MKMCAWVIERESHGLVYDTPVWLPEEPETNHNWIRIPELDIHKGSGE